MTGSTVMRLLRCQQALCGQICDKQTLDFGIAFTNPRYAQLPEANQFREVLVEDTERFSEAFEQEEQWFHDQGLFCHRWVPSFGQSVTALEAFLAPHGFRGRRVSAWVLTKWVALQTRRAVRIVHARALRDVFRSTFLDVDAPDTPGLRQSRADVGAERLDDPNYDSFVALMDGKPVGRGTLFQVGDIALITDLAVVGRHSGHHVEQVLLAHLLALAKRLAVPHICAMLKSDERTWSTMFESAGLVRDGEFVEFVRDAKPPISTATVRERPPDAEPSVF